MACIVWLLVAVALLLVMLESVETRFSSNPEAIYRGITPILFLPYRASRKGTSHSQTRLPLSQSLNEDAPKQPISSTQMLPASSTPAPETVTITMTAHTAHGLR